ncbi:MAG: hypothetical protein ABFD81_14490 [Syntrophaceae bacterium]
MPYHPDVIIVAPPYHPASNGSKALLVLCHELNLCGLETFHLNPGCWPWDPPHKPWAAIYPEIYPDNPLNAPVVVRWLLNKWRHTVQPDTDDILASWDAKYDIPGREINRMWVPTIDESIFHVDRRTQTENRRGFCYYSHKHTLAGGKVPDWMRAGGISVWDDMRPGDKQALAELFRRSEKLYSFEETAAVEEAALCGCPTEHVLNEYMPEPASPGSREEIVQSYRVRQAESARQVSHVARMIRSRLYHFQGGLT